MSNAFSSLLALVAVSVMLGACSSPDNSNSATTDAPSSDNQDQAGIGTTAAPDTSIDQAEPETGEPAVAETEERSEDEVAPPPAEADIAEPSPEEPDAIEEPGVVEATPEEAPEAESGQSSDSSTAALPDSEPDEPVDGTSLKVEVPAGPVRVQPTKDGLTYIGVDRCAKCHKVQHASWLETEHAKLKLPLDCEGCHGPGSEYKSLSIMKNPEAARAAGLVIPSREFCASCHIAGWKDDMLSRTHDHKAPTDE